MQYCTKCLQPDTRPNTKFNELGVCPACVYFASHKRIHWPSRNSILLSLVEKYRNPSAQYDCIIGVSGGKDSNRQARWVRDFLKLRPLLVCVSHPPHQLTGIGVDNISSLIEDGFDVITSSPAPETWRQLMRLSFDEFVNWGKSTELALFAGVPQIAIDYKIPLILWGENPGLQLGDLKTLGKEGYDGNNLRNMNTLSGGDFQWMLDGGFSEKDLILYKYPSLEEFEEHNIQIIYLGWFLGDWSLVNNGHVSALSGLKIRDDLAINTGDLYGVTSLDENWVTLNQMIKYYKFGFGRASDYVNEMIRLETIDRQEGIAIVEEFDGKCADRYISEFCEFIDITTSHFWDKVISVANKDLFEVKNGTLQAKFKVGTGVR